MDNGLITGIKSLRSRDIGIFLCLFIAVIAPGFLVTFYYLPGVATSYDFLKLVLLSSSLMMPLLVFNMFVLMLQIPNSTVDDVEAEWFISALITSVAVYPALFISYLFDLNFKLFALIVAGINTAMLISCSMHIRKNPDQWSKT